MSEVLIENYIKEFLNHENNKSEFILEGKISDFFKKKFSFTPDYSDISKINRNLKNKNSRNHVLKNKESSLTKKADKSHTIPLTAMTLLIAFYLNKNNLEATDVNIEEASAHIEQVTESSPEIIRRFLDPNTPISKMSRQDLILLSQTNSHVTEFNENQEERRFDFLKDTISGKNSISNYVNYLKNDVDAKGFRDELKNLADYVLYNTISFEPEEVRVIEYIIKVFDNSRFNNVVDENGNIFTGYYSVPLKKAYYCLLNPDETIEPDFNINNVNINSIVLDSDRDLFKDLENLEWDN